MRNYGAHVSATVVGTQLSFHSFISKPKTQPRMQTGKQKAIITTEPHSTQNPYTNLTPNANTLPKFRNLTYLSCAFLLLLALQPSKPRPPTPETHKLKELQTPIANQCTDFIYGQHLGFGLLWPHQIVSLRLLPECQTRTAQAPISGCTK